MKAKNVRIGNVYIIKAPGGGVLPVEVLAKKPGGYLCRDIRGGGIAYHARTARKFRRDLCAEFRRLGQQRAAAGLTVEDFYNYLIWNIYDAVEDVPSLHEAYFAGAREAGR